MSKAKFDSHLVERKMAVLAKKIAAQVEASANKGLNAARVFLTARIKEALSVPAPRRRSTDRNGNIYYSATTPAVPNAPPRKLSGRMRSATTSRMLNPATAVVGVKARGNPSRKWSNGYNYPRLHELGSSGVVGGGAHQFIRPTVVKYGNDLRSIVGRSVKLIAR